MTIQPIGRQRFEQIRAEQDEVLDLVATLYRVLAERHAPPPRVAHLLDCLRERIATHFQDEETCGLFEQPSQRSPHQKHAIDGLHREHSELLLHLQKLCDQANDGDFSTDRWDEIERGFRRFGTALCNHEARENDQFSNS